MSENKEGKNNFFWWKLPFATAVWVTLNILTVFGIAGAGTIENNFPNAFTKWQWQMLHFFFYPVIYPIFIYGLPIYISGIIPIIIKRIKRRHE